MQGDLSLPLSWPRSLFIFSLPCTAQGGSDKAALVGTHHPTQGQPKISTATYLVLRSGTGSWGMEMTGCATGKLSGSLPSAPRQLQKAESLFLGRNDDQLVRSSYDWAGHNIRLYLLFAQLSVSHGGSINMIKYPALFNSRVISMSTKPSPLLANLKASEEKWQMKFISIRRNQSKYDFHVSECHIRQKGLERDLFFIKF